VGDRRSDAEKLHHETFRSTLRRPQSAPTPAYTSTVSGNVLGSLGRSRGPNDGGSSRSRGSTAGGKCSDIPEKQCVSDYLPMLSVFSIHNKRIQSYNQYKILPSINPSKVIIALRGGISLKDG
jgi:hypothetical protein